jgi:Flp pilus assembly protein TadB
MGGFVVNADLSYSQTEGGVEVPRATITIRVPAERLDEALGRIESESSRAPLNKTINSQDVTKDYTDLQSRLRNLQAAEAQLTKIMEDAKRTEDVLSVYQELTRVRGDIEVIKGQIQYYEQSARLSSISTEILANEAVQPLTIGSWQPGGVAKNAIQALISATKFLVNAGIWLVLFVLPVAVLILLPLVFVIWLVRRFLARRKGRQAASPPAQPV